MTRSLQDLLDETVRIAQIGETRLDNLPLDEVEDARELLTKIVARAQAAGTGKVSISITADEMRDLRHYGLVD